MLWQKCLLHQKHFIPDWTEKNFTQLYDISKSSFLWKDMLGGVFHEDDFVQNGRRHSYTAICPIFINTYLFIRHIVKRTLLDIITNRNGQTVRIFPSLLHEKFRQSCTKYIYWDFSEFASKNVWSSYTQSPDEPQNPLPKFQSCSKQPFQPSRQQHRF